MSSGTQLLSRPLAEDVLELVGLHFIESPLSWCSCREFESITHSVSSLLSHGQFINETCYFNYCIFEMEWVLFCFVFFNFKACSCVDLFSMLKIWLLYGNDYLHCNFGVLGNMENFSHMHVKDLVSKRSQWIMSSPRLLKHVLWTWYDNMAVLY